MIERALLCLTFLVAPATALAQAAAESTDQSADRISCTGALQLLVAQAEGRLVASPLFRFAGRGDADEALRRLTDLAFSSPRCPAAFGARGLVKRRLASTDWVPKDAPGQRPGVPWNEDAIYDLALAADASTPAAAVAAAAATQFLLPGHVELPWLVREVGPGLLEALAVESALADSIRLFQRGRLAAWLWQPAVADSAFSGYLVAGGSADRAALELARIRLATDPAGADSLYYAAARSTDSTVALELRKDIAFIADSAELAAYDAVAPGDRAGWLRTFWETRDLASLHARGSRLAEHYRRIGAARERFRLLTYPRHYELDELWLNRDAEYDDRGLMFIKHGMPDDTASAVRGGACPNTSWLYRRPDGNMIFHFVARQNPDDWRLVETLANVGGGSGATTRVRQAGSTRSCSAVDGLLESRASLDPIYGRLAVNPDSRINWERELAITTRSRELGTTTDSDVLRFPTVLDVAWRAYGLLGDAPGRGRALMLVSVPAEALAPISSQPIGYGFEMRIVARAGSEIIEVDTVRRLAVRQAPTPGQMLTFAAEMALDAGTWNVGVVVQQQGDSAGQFLRDADVVLPDASGAALALSDIVLGDTRGGRPWNAPDGPFPLSSTGSYARGQAVPIYYEIAGAGTGGEIETEITFAREEGNDQSAIQFTERAVGPVERVRRELDTSRLRAGRYLLTVSLRTSDGRTAQREASLFIVSD